MSTVDVEAFHQEQNGSVTQKLSDATVTGIDKLVQNVIIELMTAKGSILYNPKHGSRLIPFLLSTAATETDVFIAFAAAKTDVIRHLRRLETKDTPMNERLANIELLQIAITGDDVILHILVTSAAGETATRTLPLNFNL